MSILRTASLPLLLAAALGLSACGGDDASTDTGNGGTTPAETVPATSAAGAAVEEKLPELSEEVQERVATRQERMEKITKDIQTGKISVTEGQKKIDDMVSEVQKDSADLTKKAAEQAAAEGKKSGEEVTELQL
ncbi:MAG: hypothetical protein Q7T55_22570, partial [Solirubrobacteraceae bacterium]|nr:hypothetical protein [Solirubrobacteraceae bacterium]